MDITLLIPTLNRSEFLIRLLHYYKDLNFQGQISIGDSSGEFHLERAKSAIEKLQGGLNILYQEYPGLNDSECMQRQLQSVTTSYVAWVADDDFLVPSALAQCVGFLAQHSDYTAAHGVAAVFSLEHGEVYGPIKMAGFNKQPVLEAESSSQRLADYLGDYSSCLFSVHRVATWRTIYSQIAPVPDKYFRGELIPGCHSAIEGKIKGLDVLYILRQAHSLQTSRQTAHLDTFDFIHNDEWAPSYRYLPDRLPEELAGHDGISDDEAREVVKKAFWTYIQRSLSKRWQISYAQDGTGFQARVRKAARQSPAIRNAWHRVRSFLPGRGNQLSIVALLRPTSPYHNDFMPIYRAVTNEPAVTYPGSGNGNVSQHPGANKE